MSVPILLVEDSSDDVIFLSRALRKAGDQNFLHVASDAEQAIDYLSGKPPYDDRVHYPLPRLVLLDLKLPSCSGLDVLGWIRSQSALSQMIVIVFSSSDHPDDIKGAYAKGANSFVTKPANPGDMAGILRPMLDYWLRRNVPLGHEPD